jgi:hypothetical protein
MVDNKLLVGMTIDEADRLLELMLKDQDVVDQAAGL